MKLLTVAIGAMIAVSFLAIAMTTQDLLWFWPAFDEQPRRITLYCQGESFEVQPGSGTFQQLVEGLSRGMWGMKRWSSLSMSYSTLAEYRAGKDAIVLEYFYHPPVTIHSYYRFFKGVDTLIVPLEGRHASDRPVFAMRDGHTTAGAFHLDTNAPLRATVGTMTLCP